jgi:hypothetical protein
MKSYSEESDMWKRAAIGTTDGEFLIVTDGEKWKANKPEIEEIFNQRYSISKVSEKQPAGTPYTPVEWMVEDAINEFPGLKLIWVEKENGMGDTHEAR